MKKGILVIISGAAGTGKGMVINSLRNRYDNYAYSVSSTTRAPRVGEENGINYHFITHEEFKSKIDNNEMLEYTRYCGNYYGTSKDELKVLDEGKNLILEIEVEGACNVKRLCPEAVSVFIMPPSYKILEDRLRGRGTNTEDDIAARMKRSLEEIQIAKNYDYIVVNHDGKIDETANNIAMIISSEKFKASRNINIIDEYTKDQSEEEK